MKDYFTRADGTDELKCSCGKCNLTVRQSTRDKLNTLRDYIGTPLKVWGARCPLNKDYTGETSRHSIKEPCAVDINENKETRLKVLGLAISMGFSVGIGETKLHLDDDETRAKQTFWIYN